MSGLESAGIASPEGKLKFFFQSLKIWKFWGSKSQPKKLRSQKSKDASIDGLLDSIFVSRGSKWVTSGIQKLSSLFRVVFDPWPLILLKLMTRKLKSYKNRDTVQILWKVFPCKTLFEFSCVKFILESKKSSRKICRNQNCSQRSPKRKIYINNHIHKIYHTNKVYLSQV